MADDELLDRADGEPGPEKEPKSAKAWLSLIADAQKAFKDYQDKADSIDKLYANLERLANVTRDRQFQMFWANIQVLAPSVYSRPPVPVVVPRFQDTSPLKLLTSELLERTANVLFEIADIDSIMRLIRDDLVVLARGCVWLRYEAKGTDGYLYERVCIDYVDRKDFLHDPARTWGEVDWVAKASYLDKKAMRKRFQKTSGDAYKDAAYETRKDDSGDDSTLKACVWEIWSKSLNRVVWVSEGCDKLLDDGPPHLTLDGFFPCPRPAYSTVQRRSLVPIPDMLFYKDQLEEINELTARIGALSDAVKVRGFYPAGAGEIGDAIEAAVKKTTDNQVLVPVANWAMIGTGGVKDMIVWLPIDMIVTTITELVALRKQLIDDVYQITGLSDIMRGSTEPSETLGAQELKSQYGSIRIRDRQAELVRLARDITRIAGEIMAENYQPKTFLAMSQMTVKSNADVLKEVAPLQEQLQKLTADAQTAMQDPETQAMAQRDPQKAREVMQQVQQHASQLEQQIAKLKQQPTLEAAMALLRDQKLRPFMLDIETDSTIAPDENATKQRATEFVTAVGGFMAQAMTTVKEVPQAAPVASQMLKFVASQFRAGRELEGVIQEFADQMKDLAAQPQPPNPEAIKAQQEAQQAQQQQQIDAQAAQAKMAADQQKQASDHQRVLIDAQAKADQRDLEWRKAQLTALTSIEVARIGAKTDADSTAVSAELEAMLGMAKMDHEAQQAEQDRIHEQQMAARDQEHQQSMAERTAEQQTEPA